MALPSTPPLTLLQIKAQFTGPSNLRGYLAGGGVVPSGTANATGTQVPSSGSLTMATFLGTSAQPLPINFSSAKVNTTSTVYLSGVAYGAGLFVAVDEEGNIYSSPTGQTWTTRSSNTHASYVNIDFVNDTFVATAQAGYYAYSTNGTSWTVVQMHSGTGSANSVNFWLNGCIYANSLYVIPASSTAGNNELQIFTASSLTSATGWTGHAVGTMTSVFGMFQPGTGSDAFTQPIGTTIAYNGTTAVALALDLINADLSIAYSTNMTTWSNTIILTGVNQGQQYGITYDGTTFYVVNQTLYIDVNPGPADVLSSTTGTSGWANSGNVPILSTNGISSIQYVGNVYCALGGGVSGGFIYATGAPGTNSSWQSGNTSPFSDIAFGNNIFVAVGVGGNVAYYT